MFPIPGWYFEGCMTSGYMDQLLFCLPVFLAFHIFTFSWWSQFQIWLVFRNGVPDCVLCLDGWTPRPCCWCGAYSWIGFFFNREYSEKRCCYTIERWFPFCSCWWYGFSSFCLNWIWKTESFHFSTITECNPCFKHRF